MRAHNARASKPAVKAATGNHVRRLSVRFDDVSVQGLLSLDDLESESEIIDSTAQGTQGVEFRPGRQKPGRIVITKDWSNTSEFFTWRKTVMDGQVDRKSVSVIFHNDAGQEAGRYNFFDCWPVKWVGPSLNAKNSGHATEKLEIVFERMEMK